MSQTYKGLGETSTSLGPLIAGAILYLSIFIGVDWASYIHPLGGLNITPWNPQAALAVALLVWRPSAVWLVWVALSAAELVVRDLPMPLAATAVSMAALTLGYSASAWMLRRGLGARPAFVTRRHLLILVTVVVAGALTHSVLYVAVLAAFGHLAAEPFTVAIWRGWVGDSVGMLVALPLLLALSDRERRAVALAMLRTAECIVAMMAIAASTWAVFRYADQEPFKFVYLLFLPVVWLAARFGIVGAIWATAITQVLIIVAVQSVHAGALTVFELQLLTAALAATSLLLGMTVEEREHAALELRASLHAAAAGDMAAALAHELNQPLSAIGNYAKACQLLAADVAPAEGRRSSPTMIEVTEKLVQEAARAGEVVKRLRDFFRARSTELRPTYMDALVERVMRSQLTRAQALGVEMDWQVQSELPPPWIDDVQIEVVMRNLVANAIEAASQPDARHTVHVRANLSDGVVLVTVRDGGLGVSAAQLPHLFETRMSDKPEGMGLGLSISRAIVEAHGGQLWAEIGPGGRFAFSLPLILMVDDD